MCVIKPQRFITTNFDDLIEKSTVQNCLTYKSVACKDDIAGINGEKFILKAHGDFLHENIILMEEDYLNYSEIFKLTETLLKSIFSTNTVVFIGYGLNDYNIKLILNWAKTLLEGNFNKPIFIYTDNEELSDLDIQYQESRGLSIIDFMDFVEGSQKERTAIDYETRYTAVLNKILLTEEENINGRDKNELFEILYNRLKPLNSFNVLKTTDIRQVLHQFVFIGEDGFVKKNPNSPNFIELFCELDKSVSSFIEVEKINTIKDVLRKARIYGYEEKDIVFKVFDWEHCEFADMTCILFDYKSMYHFAEKDYSDLNDKHKKVFYLTKLMRYEEAFLLSKQLTQEAYEQKNYLIYYFAQINRLNIYHIFNRIFV